MQQIDLPAYDRQVFQQKYGPWAVIAGASEGTGASFAEQLAKMGIHLLLVSRRQSALDALASRLKAEYGVECRTLALDLMKQGAGREMVDAAADLDVGLYVSNAGSDGAGNSFLDSPVERAQKLLTMNADTLTVAVHGFGNRFKARGGGGIIIMSSGTGLGGQPWLAVYAASKGYEINLAESLWAELAGDQIDVLGVIAPGMDTPTLRRLLAGKEVDTDALYRPDDVAHMALSQLGVEPLVAFAAGPEPEAFLEAARERKRKLELITEFARQYYE